MATSALSLKAIEAYYGDSHVLQDVSFDLGEARMLGLLGRNGAGKSTCMNVTMGLLPPRHGDVLVFGDRVTGLSPEMIAARGVALVPQGRRIFKSLTVRENLMVAARKPANGQHAASTPPGPPRPCSRCFRASPTATTRSPRICPAASSRCWRSAAR